MNILKIEEKCALEGKTTRDLARLLGMTTAKFKREFARGQLNVEQINKIRVFLNIEDDADKLLIFFTH